MLSSSLSHFKDRERERVRERGRWRERGRPYLSSPLHTFSSSSSLPHLRVISSFPVFSTLSPPHSHSHSFHLSLFLLVCLSLSLHLTPFLHISLSLSLFLPLSDCL